MRRTYKATFFASVYFGVLLVLAVFWYLVSEYFLDGARHWGTLFLVAFGILGLPSTWARVTINDRGIEQHFFRRWFIGWTEIVSWKRVTQKGSDGPDLITIKTCRGSFTLNANCVFGKRLAEVEAELKRMVPQVETVPRCAA